MLDTPPTVWISFIIVRYEHLLASNVEFLWNLRNIVLELVEDGPRFTIGGNNLGNCSNFGVLHDDFCVNKAHYEGYHSKESSMYNLRVESAFPGLDVCTFHKPFRVP